MINQLHNISTILDSHANPSNAYIHVPPLPPPQPIHPPSHAQVEFHSSHSGKTNVITAEKISVLTRGSWCIIPTTWGNGCMKQFLVIKEVHNGMMIRLDSQYPARRNVFIRDLVDFAYILLNKETMRIEESLNDTFDESFPEPKSSPSIEDDRIIEPVVQNPIRSPSLEANASEPGYLKSVKEARGTQ
ncbi:hypothetical protein Tco_0773968 [Tanacetum coccineum]|uniref:Uncharacterized protein n=1 Tax=Tanacetum coccineum TaxID=301880 RepID=A0ABQ4ZQW4_9ASTR